MGDWDKLKALAIITLKIAPGNQEALTALEDSQKRKTKAEAYADNIKLAPTAEKYLTLSLDYYQEGKYEQSITAAEDALKLKPDYADAYNNIGCAYNAMNQFNKGAEVLNKALALSPNYERAKNNLILAKNHAVPTSETISGTRLTAEEYLNQSLIYFNQRQYDLCIAACISALTVKPDYDLAYNNLCSAYNKLGMWDDAIAAGKKGLEVSPDNERIKNNLVIAIKGKGKGK
jgi:tetratricopeptide (TPR) repeat protein